MKVLSFFLTVCSIEKKKKQQPQATKKITNSIQRPPVNDCACTVFLDATDIFFSSYILRLE